MLRKSPDSGRQLVFKVVSTVCCAANQLVCQLANTDVNKKRTEKCFQ